MKSHQNKKFFLIKPKNRYFSFSKGYVAVEFMARIIGLRTDGSYLWYQIYHYRLTKSQLVLNVLPEA